MTDATMDIASGRTSGPARRLFGLPPSTWVLLLLVLHVAGFVWLLNAEAREALVPAFPGDVLARFRPIAQLSRPWVEQPVEFPPLSVLVLQPLRGITDGRSAVLVHMAVQMLLHLATAAVVRRGWGDRAGTRYLAITLPLLPLMVTRLDQLSALLVAIGLLLVARRVDDWGGVVLGLAVLAKIWPGVLLLVLAKRRPTVTIAGLATTAIGGLLWVAWVGWDAVGQVLGFRGATGWHMESVVGVVYRMINGGEPSIESGAWRLGTADRRVLLALVAVGLLGIAWRAWRPKFETEDMLFAVTLLLVVAPLLSPQYMVWLAIPLALAAPRPSRDLLALVAFVLSTAVIYWIGEIIRGEGIGWFIVVGRNLALAGMLALAFVPVRARRDPLAGAG